MIVYTHSPTNKIRARTSEEEKEAVFSEAWTDNLLNSNTEW